MTRRTRPGRHQRSSLRAEYPSPEECERIIERRNELLREVLLALDSGQSVVWDRQMARLARRYGPEDLQVVLSAFKKNPLGRDLIGETPFFYREYRRAFARFGGHRPFLNKEEYERLQFEYAMLFGERQLVSHTPPSLRERELYDLLLTQADYWQDVTPPAVPPRPPDWHTPPVDDYDAAVCQLLEWGWDLEGHTEAYGDQARWRPAAPCLVRMALDERLLQGWPGEAASWAPYHALHILGALGAYQFAGSLAHLLHVENDWLSDRLSVVWAQMGPQAEPILWDCLHDRTLDAEKRSLALRGLELMTQLHPDRCPVVVGGLVRLLRSSGKEDAKTNSYIVFVLDRLRAVEAADAIADAFEQDKVGTQIVHRDDVSLLWDR